MCSARASWPLHDCASALASARDLCQCLGLCMGSVSVPWPLHGICASALASAWDLCQYLGLCMGSVPVPWPLHGICASALASAWDLCQCLGGLCMGSVSWPLGSVPVPAWTYEYLHSVHAAQCTCCSIHRRGFVVVYSSNSFTSESALCNVF